MNTLRHRNATRRLVGLALLALLLAQWTALAHAIAHAPLHAGAAVAANAGAAWGHHAGTPACHLVDHLLIGQAAGDEPAPVPCLRHASTLVVASDLSIGPGLALRAYQARGPPRA